MSEHSPNDESSAADEAGARAPKPRLPYEPPAIEESSAFETLSLACAKSRRQCFPGPYSAS